MKIKYDWITITRYALHLLIGFIGITALLKLVPYLTHLLELVVQLHTLTDTTPEFKILLVCLSIWVTCTVFIVGFNVLWKLESILKEYKEAKKHD